MSKATEKSTMTALEALDELERRIRTQAEAQEMLSMPWRAHMADIMHLTALRNEIAAD